jgi:hypothetical protein
MKIENVWILRTWMYIACIVLIIVAAFNKFFIHRETYEEKTLRKIRMINAQFWPPDLVPHPNLPETPPEKPYEIQYPGGINA